MLRMPHKSLDIVLYNKGYPSRKRCHYAAGFRVHAVQDNDPSPQEVTARVASGTCTFATSFSILTLHLVCSRKANLKAAMGFGLSQPSTALRNFKCSFANSYCRGQPQPMNVVKIPQNEVFRGGVHSKFKLVVSVITKFLA